MFIVKNCASLPDSVLSQSRKDFMPTENWLKYNKSGEVKYLQIQGTAPRSDIGKGLFLDGSCGEQLIKIKTIPILKDEVVEWTVKNKNEKSVFVVYTSFKSLKIPFEIEGEKTVEFITKIDTEGYGYIVVASENVENVEFKAKVCDEDANTTSGNTMKVCSSSSIFYYYFLKSMILYLLIKNTLFSEKYLII